MLSLSTEIPFDPVKREALIAWARVELTRAELQIDILEEVVKRTGVVAGADLAENRRVAERLRLVLEALERASGLSVIH